VVKAGRIRHSQHSCCGFHAWSSSASGNFSTHRCRRKFQRLVLRYLEQVVVAQVEPLQLEGHDSMPELAQILLHHLKESDVAGISFFGSDSCYASF
jgi:hypothetical protein